MISATAGAVERLNGRATLWLARIAAVVLALLALLTFFDVVGRWLFNSPFSSAVELTEFGMGLIVYLGVGLTTHENGHISVDLVTIRLRDRVRAALEIVTNLLALAFLVVMVWRIWERAEALYSIGDKTQILLLPLWPVAFAMAFGSLFFLTGFFLYIVKALARLGGRGDSA